MSDRQLKRTIADLTTMERKCFGSRQRFGVYVYLGAVLEFYKLLRRNKCAKRTAGRIAKLFRIRTQKRTHPIRIIIDASSAAEEKTKSRWCRALRGAWHERSRFQNLTTYLSQIGGVAGAAASSALQQRKQNSRGVSDMADQVPKSPLMVHVPLLEPGQLFVRGGKVFRQPDVTEADPQDNRVTGPPRNA